MAKLAYVDFDDLCKEDSEIIEQLIPQNLYEREKLLALLAAYKKYTLEELMEKLQLNNADLIDI